MRRYLVAGNWKLNKGPAEARQLAQGVRQGIAKMDLHGDVLVCPPYVSIPAAGEFADGRPLLLGGQDCASHAAGAYTGEISAEMLKEAGAQYVIVAHSERRAYQNETDDLFIQKINLAHAAGLTAIFCYGEVIEERKAGNADQVVKAQLTGVLPHLDSFTPENTVLAYEPVWAIGTGETATPEIAQEIHAFSRGIVGELFDASLAGGMRILYGGSCKPSNARELIGQPDVDGGLIGGASLKPEDFVGIVEGAEAACVAAG